MKEKKKKKNEEKKRKQEQLGRTMPIVNRRLGQGIDEDDFQG
jgi:hypothetical protein